MSNKNLQCHQVKAAGESVEPQDRDQQRRGRNEREQEKFERGPGPILAAVHCDQDRHRNQRQLPKAVVEHQVQRNEHAEHGRLLNEEERKEDLASLLDCVPARYHAHRRQQPGQHHQPQAQPVHAHVVKDGRILNPGSIDCKFKSALAQNEVRRQMQRKAKRQQ